MVVQWSKTRDWGPVNRLNEGTSMLTDACPTLELDDGHKPQLRVLWLGSDGETWGRVSTAGFVHL